MAWEYMGNISAVRRTYSFNTKKFRYKFEAPEQSTYTLFVWYDTGDSSYRYFDIQKNTSRIFDKGSFRELTPPLDGDLTLHTSLGSAGVIYLYREDINSSPSISVSTTDARTLYENDTLNITGTAQDADSGNTVTVKYSINNGTARTLHTFISDGSAVSFNKPLTFKRDKLHDGSTAVTGDLQEGVTHTLRVWAEDDQGGKSTIHSRTFNVIPNRPEVKVNGQPRVVETVYCKVNGQAREVVKMWTKVNGELREV